MDKNLSTRFKDYQDQRDIPSEQLSPGIEGLSSVMNMGSDFSNYNKTTISALQPSSFDNLIKDNVKLAKMVKKIK